MHRKKKVVLIMNCVAIELASNLLSSRNLTAIYDVEWFTTYTSKDDEQAKQKIYEALKTADVLVTQSVQNIGWLTNDELAKHSKKGCHLIRLAFWRFEGFWPIKLQHHRESLWYLPVEAGSVSSFDEYISFEISQHTIKDCFEVAVEKLAKIDDLSDLKMLDFFLANFKKINMFSDSWHPTSFFYFVVAKYIFAQLGLGFDLDLRPNDRINRNRYRFVLDCVADVLDLNYDRSLLRFEDYWLTREVFYEFSMFAASQLVGGSPSETAALFERWRSQNEINEHMLDVAPLGCASQSSLSSWSQPDDAQRAISGRRSGGFSFHTKLEPRPWWTVDLRDFREVAAIRIWNRDGNSVPLKARAVPLYIDVSLDEITWKNVAVINFTFGNCFDDRPLNLDIAGPLVARHVRLLVGKTSCLHLDQIKVLTKVMGQQ